MFFNNIEDVMCDLFKVGDYIVVFFVGLVIDGFCMFVFFVDVFRKVTSEGEDFGYILVEGFVFIIFVYVFVCV